MIPKTSLILFLKTSKGLMSLLHFFPLLPLLHFSLFGLPGDQLGLLVVLLGLLVVLQGGLVGLGGLVLTGVGGRV